jgi:hypothetical protein
MVILEFFQLAADISYKVINAITAVENSTFKPKVRIGIITTYRFPDIVRVSSFPSNDQP